MSMKELEEMLGVAEMFPEGCGGADAETVGVVVGFHSEGIPENIEGMDAEASGEGSGYTDLDSDKAGQDAEGEASRHDAEGETSQDSEGEDSHQDIEGETSRQDTEGETSRQDTSRQDTEGKASQDIEGKIRHQVTSRQDTEGETSADAVKSASSIEDLDTGADIFESSGDHETVDEQETDTNSTSTLVYILSTALSILKAPLCPVFSTATQLPGQVIQFTEPFKHLFYSNFNSRHLELHPVCGINERQIKSPCQTLVFDSVWSELVVSKPKPS